MRFTDHERFRAFCAIERWICQPFAGKQPTITDNPKLEAEGKAEKIAGKVQGKVGEVKKVFGK